MGGKGFRFYNSFISLQSLSSLLAIIADAGAARVFPGLYSSELLDNFEFDYKLLNFLILNHGIKIAKLSQTGRFKGFIRLRYGIISDIHSNLNALNVVLNSLENQGIDKLICLGDIVGYGPEPNECVEVVRKNADIVLAGNHDFAVLGRTDISRFNRYAKSAINWTIKTISDESLQFLSSCLLEKKLENYNFVHATIDEPDKWKYILSLQDAALAFQTFDETICFFGHSHVPSIFVEDELENIEFYTQTRLKIRPENKYLINVGSVGQPRDRNPKACFATFDSTTFEYELFRVEYDIADTQKKMKRANLDKFLINRLQSGK